MGIQNMRVNYFRMYDSIFIIVISCLSLVIGLTDCDSERPKTRKGWSRHRTLYIPDKFLSDSNSENNWANALCCVYTHVKKTSKKKAKLEVYDGSSYKYRVIPLKKLQRRLC